jgi:ubiquitin carboxyl-terminal hydrolase 47
LQRYLKPETLDGNNLYFCEQCQAKVEADRFVKFIKLPKLLSLMLQRFTFDYMTMSRQKLNDEVRFPWVLNMNDYMNGYEDIPNKLSEEKAMAEFEESPP